MNDAFAWDIGDLAKFVLLRHLVRAAEGDARLRIGSVWCYTRDQPPPGHGSRIGYLDDSDSYGRRVRGRDPVLYALLQSGSRTSRSIASNEYRLLLPDDTAHVFDPLDDASKRSAYWLSALAATADAPLVFFDPDDGIGLGNKSGVRAARSISYDEVAPFYRRGQSLVLYQHQNREKGGLTTLAARQSRALRETLGAEEVFVLSWHRLQARLFIVVPAPPLSASLRSSVRTLLASSWGTDDGNGADFRDALIPRNEGEARKH